MTYKHISIIYTTCGRLTIPLYCNNHTQSQHDQAIKHYGQEGLNATVLPTHTIMKIINYY